MAHPLRAGLAFCFVNERPVFLDVTRDRYFTIQGSLEAAFKELVAGRDLSRESIDRLLSAGILEPEGGRPIVPSPPRIVSPGRSVIEGKFADRRAGFAVTVKTAICLVRSRRRLRRDGFARIINELRARKRHTGDARHSFIEARAAEFQAARCLFPAPPNCLPDSLALLDYLYNQGVVADLVIGVRMAPYGAHCWVQTREALLNEAVDCAASFTPILTA